MAITDESVLDRLQDDIRGRLYDLFGGMRDIYGTRNIHDKAISIDAPFLEEGPEVDFRGRLYAIYIKFFVAGVGSAVKESERGFARFSRVHVRCQPLQPEDHELQDFFESDGPPGDYDREVRNEMIAFEMRLFGMQCAREWGESSRTTPDRKQADYLDSSFDAINSAISQLYFLRNESLEIFLDRTFPGAATQEQSARSHISIISKAQDWTAMMLTYPGDKNLPGDLFIVNDLIQIKTYNHPIYYGWASTIAKEKFEPLRSLARSGAYMSIPYDIGPYLSDGMYAFASACVFHTFVENVVEDLTSNITDLAAEISRIEKDIQVGLQEEKLNYRDLQKLRGEFTACVQKLRSAHFEHHEAFLIEASDCIKSILPGAETNDWQPDYVRLDKATLRSYYEGLQALIEIVRAQLTDASAELQQKESLAIAQRGLEISENSWKISQQSLDISENSWKIAQATRKDSQTMRAIAFITMIFLPATFVSSFFGMNFFNGIPEKPGFDAARSFVWIYFTLAIPLTALVVGGFYFWEYLEERRTTQRKLNVVLRASSLHDWVVEEKKKAERDAREEMAQRKSSEGVSKESNNQEGERSNTTGAEAAETA
ncbi:hypothetical protein FB567DRAFT_516403 [Paraphoma chrysanthemicola]|uniref:Uncharacterized protein n=1 Tax=Paraphoma chrysanthemicola TaxID=798071 RepID=A0A8K0RFE8_9PLEO|nr:hypothetical protein FB567DRAFT_516403 [Paraphoma chrysanthemicola]